MILYNIIFSLGVLGEGMFFLIYINCSLQVFGTL
jgi:hypothetical protein